MIQLIIDLKMHYSLSGHDKKTKHTQTNTHLLLAQLLHFNNGGSFHGLVNNTPIDFYYFLMVLRCH
jgi:hypothetical protein